MRSILVRPHFTDPYDAVHRDLRQPYYSPKFGIIRSSSLGFHFREHYTPACHILRLHYYHQTMPQRQDDSSSSSSSSEEGYSSASSGTCDDSSRSGSPVRNASNTNHHGKKSQHHVLLREVRRLRAENAYLRSSVDILKNDLRIERESRRNIEECHQRYLEKTESEIAELLDKIDTLTQQLEDAKASGPCSPAVAGDEEEEGGSSHEDNDHSEEEEDEEEEDGLTDDERFEQLAASYLRQAIVSNLTSARANLELDDLLLKYDPSPPVILRTLATTFIVWIRDMVTARVDSASAASLMTTGVQTGFLQFWKAILEQHVQDDIDQYQFLSEAERTLDRDNKEMAPIIDNYHRLLVMLYKYDIVDTDAVSNWWHSKSNDGFVSNTVAIRLRDVTRKFVEWMNQDDESEDDDGEEEDDDDGASSDTVIQGDDEGFDYDMDETRLVDDMLDDDRKYCACQFDQVTSTTDTNTCKCDIPTPTATVKKPKKTVRLNL